MKASVIPCGPAVNESERRAFDRLKAGLIGHPGDGEWLLLTNLTFSATHRLQSDEIDIVAIGPPGVRVIEVKHWTAAWVRKHPDRVAQEADRVTSKARKIGTTLRAKLGALPHVEGVFLVTETAARVEGLAGRRVRGVRFCTLSTWRETVAAAAPAVLATAQIRMAARLLEPRSGVTVAGELQRLAAYARLELRSPADERFHRIYRGTHASRQEHVILHLYDLSASDEANAEARARREHDALRRLQEYAWAPRIVDSFQEAPGYPGELAFFTVADPAAPGVIERVEDDAWDSTSRLSFARNAVRAMQELHAAHDGNEPLLHRNLTPRSILVRHDNAPILTGFEHARIPAEVTVATPPGVHDPDHTVAPEVCAQGRGAADWRSDVYALCASLSVLFDGQDEELARAAMQTMARGTAPDPAARASLDDLDRSLSKLLGESPPTPPAPSARFWTEDQVVHFAGQDYRIVAKLGSGGVGTTFKVVEIDRDTEEDLGAYVAKVVRDRGAGERVLHAHRLVRSHLRHAAFSTIYQVAPEWRDNGFAALLTWIEGGPVGEYEGLLRELADDLGEASDEALALRWLCTACEALGELHRNGLVHGDISPRNLILSGTDLILTDYDCVGKVDEPIAAPGTVLYCSPSHAAGLRAAASDDFYALAATMFQVLFAREPFRYEGDRSKDRGLNWDGVDQSAYPVLAPFLARATNPAPEQRFATASDALLALSTPPRPTPPAPQPQRRENEVAWLSELLQSYPGSPLGNRETRGLDSDFADRTYVETRLEQALYRELREGGSRLVVLCGNAGDGKTALLQRLARRLGFGGHGSAQRIVEGRTEAGLMVRMNLDGSASWEGRSSGDLLDEFLEPFQHGRPAEEVAHLLAINDGRLLEWIEDVELDHGGPTPLTGGLTSALEGRGEPAGAHLRFVNLNQRSLVGAITPDRTGIDTGFLEQLVDRLYGGERAAEMWAPCHTCTAQDRCQVFRAARLFAPHGGADEAVRGRARLRLFEALQAVHLRGETHVTVREMRATLVYVLFGVHFCSDYHAGESGDLLPYWDRAFDPESSGRQGDVLRELVRFDPALEAHPHIDRALLHPPPDSGDPDAPAFDEDPDRLVDRRRRLASERRHAYFEWTAAEIERLTGDPEALGLARGRHLRRFRDLAIVGNSARDEAVRSLCRGISRLEALPPQALDRPGVVPLRITPRTPTETAFWVEKSNGDFRLKVDLPDTGDVDRLHRQALLIYRYHDGREETLRLGAELFHLLLELADGYQLGDAATDDAFAHLSIFVQRLVREDERRLIAWNPMNEATMYEIAASLRDAEEDTRQLLAIAPLELARDAE